QVGVTSQDRDLRYTWLHNSTLGFQPSDVVGKRDEDLLERPEDVARLETLKRRVLATGQGERAEVPVWHRGVERWYDLSVQPHRDRSGAVIGITTAAVDITARKHVESDLAFVSALSDAFTPAASPDEVARIAATQIAEHFGLSRCLLVEIDARAEVATVFHEYCRAGDHSLMGDFRIADFHTPAEQRDLERGIPVVIADVDAAPRPSALASNFAALGVGAIANAPFLSDGRLRFVLSAIHRTPHAWREGKSRLLQEIAARTYLRLERARAEAALKAAHDTFYHLVAHSPFGIYVVDSTFRLVQVSAGAQKVFAQVRPLLGRDFAEVLRILWEEPFASDAIAIFRRTLETGEPYHAPSMVERRNDIEAVEAYDWKTERITLPDGRFGVVCHFYDLSDRQRYEAALRAADREKDEFLAMLAHELRNPLAPIRTAAGVLRALAPGDAAIARCRDTIERQAGLMARLLDDLLDVSRLSSGRLLLDRRPVGLADVMAAAVETSRPLIDGRRQQLTITGGAGLVVDGDAARLTQVFANLLNNAAKFSPAGSAIAVSVSADAGAAVVQVRDPGIGIAPEMLPRVFDLFVQAPDAAVHGAGGLGIGLSLARRLVDMHDGAISVHSPGAGLGSEFTVRLPLASASVAAARTREPAGDHFAGRRILVVDDNVDSADVTAMLLGAAGGDVRTAYDGEEAVAVAESFRPHVALLDLGLPGLDGLEVCRRIRATDWGAEVVAIAISGWARDEDREQTQAAGFDHHLMKPLEPAQLLEVIRAAVNRPTR
ncbi:MAG: PAS domain-containing protein, partial [Acidobacteria bacterium]|nr:PAS domain-containing protein [Acidobacteriota bacterium]